MQVSASLPLLSCSGLMGRRIRYRLVFLYDAHRRHQARAEHGVYGYSVPLPEVTQEVVKYLERTAHYKIEPEWIVWSHGLVPALTVASRMAGGEGDAVMVGGSCVCVTDRALLLLLLVPTSCARAIVGPSLLTFRPSHPSTHMRCARPTRPSTRPSSGRPRRRG